jgi:hypothetical protein
LAKTLPECFGFDGVLRRVVSILSKHSDDLQETIWYEAIDCLKDMKQDLILKSYCNRFFQSRLNMLIELMATSIPFIEFLDHALEKY